MRINCKQCRRQTNRRSTNFSKYLLLIVVLSYPKILFGAKLDNLCEIWYIHTLAWSKDNWSNLIYWTRYWR